MGPSLRPPSQPAQERAETCGQSYGSSYLEVGLPFHLPLYHLSSRPRLAQASRGSGSGSGSRRDGCVQPGIPIGPSVRSRRCRCRPRHTRPADDPSHRRGGALRHARRGRTAGCAERHAARGREPVTRRTRQALPQRHPHQASRDTAATARSRPSPPAGESSVFDRVRFDRVRFDQLLCPKCRREESCAHTSCLFHVSKAHSRPQLPKAPSFPPTPTPLLSFFDPPPFRPHVHLFALRFFSFVAGGIERFLRLRALPLTGGAPAACGSSPSGWRPLTRRPTPPGRQPLARRRCDALVSPL